MSWEKDEDALDRHYKDDVLDGDLTPTEFDKKFASAYGYTEPAVRAKRRRMGLTDETSVSECEQESTPESLTVPADFDAHDFVSDYVYQGGGLTQQELARKYGLTKTEVRALLKAMGVTKASLPLSPGELATDDIEDLVERTLNARARKVEVKARRKEVRSLERKWLEAQAELNNQDRIIEAAKEIAGQMPLPELGVTKTLSRELYGYDDPFVIHAPTTDEHVGQYNWEPETWGEDYDVDIACERLVAHAHLLRLWIYNQPGYCARLHRTFVGDLLHALLGETEHGTGLDQDGRSARVWGKLMEALRDTIEILRPVCDQLVISGARGNHDGEIEFFLAMHTLGMLYEDCPDVEINVTPGRQAAFFEGTTLHVLDHGYGIRKLNANKAIVALERSARQSSDDWGRAEEVKVYVGHLHQRETHEADERLELIRLPAMCEVDDYSSSLRYRGKPGASFYRLDEKGRLQIERRVYVDELEQITQEVAA